MGMSKVNGTSSRNVTVPPSWEEEEEEEERTDMATSV
jgi:hypothetical protein